MSPTKDTPTDAAKLSFPLQVVIMIVSAVGAIYATTYGMRSDVRDILTRMEMQATLDAKDAAIQKERHERLQSDVLALQREDRMRQFELKALETRLSVLEPTKGKRP